MLALGVHWKPTLDDALALLKNFDDAPKARKANDGENGTEEYIFELQGSDNGNDSRHQKCPPRAGAEIVFCFDDNRMKNTDDEEGAQTKQGTLIV